eukprot:gene20730-27545_t
MDMSTIKGSVVADSLWEDGYPRELVEHCLATFGSRVSMDIGSEAEHDGADVWSLDGKKKEKWESSELDAYVRDLKVLGMNVVAFLLEFACSS